MKSVWASVLALSLLAGCAGLMHENRPTAWLALETAPARGGLRSGGPSIEVGRFTAAAPFGTDRVASREGTSRWTFASYHRWVAEPGEMVAAHLRESLSRADLFSAVFTPPEPLEADYRLSGAVRLLFWDRGQKSAVLEVEATLVDRPGRLRGFWVHRAVAPVRGDTVDAFLTAASAAQAQVLGELGADLAAALAAVPPPGP